MYRSLPTGWGDLSENPTFPCPDFLLSRTLPPRPFSGRQRFLGPSSAGPELPQCCLPLSQALPAGSFWFRLLMLFWMAFSEGGEAWCRLGWFGRSMSWFCVHLCRTFCNLLPFFLCSSNSPSGVSLIAARKDSHRISCSWNLSFL